MTADATTQLIQRILAHLPPAGVAAQQSSTDFLTQVENGFGATATYVQVLGTAEGPAAQIIAAQIAKTDVAAGATQEAAALATAGTLGIGAAVLLVISTLLAIIGAGADSASSETQELQRLGQEIQDIENVELAQYWQQKLTAIMAAWNSPTGGLGNDLDDLASQGTNGHQVVQDVGQYHENGLAFVNALIPSRTLGAEVYWERPVVSSQDFAAQPVPYPVPSVLAPKQVAVSSAMGWYGKLPQPQAGPPLGGGGNQMALDPSSALPFLLLGIQSYLALEALANVIDTTQPTLAQFVSGFKGDLQAYAEFLMAQYELAVAGIVMTDVPAPGDILGFLYFVAEIVDGASFPDNTEWWGGSLPSAGGPASVPFAGSAWNGVYGAVDSYPEYGAYQPSPPVPLPYAAPAYVIDVIDTGALVAQLERSFGSALNQQSVLRLWTLPWVVNRVLVGRLARWKAIYLFNGYDKVWSAVEHLAELAKLPAPQQPLLPDGTRASGNWSVRELCQMLQQGGDIGYFAGLQGVGNYSVTRLVEFLDVLAKGGWGGPAAQDPLSVPASFRDRLAAVAV